MTRLRRALACALGCTMVAPTLAGAGSIEAGGLWGAGQSPPWFHWSSLEAGPLWAGVAEYHLPPGSLVLDWGPPQTQLVWAGLRLDLGPSVTSVWAGAAVPRDADFQWAQTPFQFRLDPPYAFGVRQDWGPWSFAGASAVARGTILASDGVLLGDLNSHAWFLTAGLSALSLVYGEGSVGLKAERSEIVWWFRGTSHLDFRFGGLVSPEAWRPALVYMEGQLSGKLNRGIFPQGTWATDEQSRFRSLFALVDPSWSGSGWAAGLTIGAALFWVENPVWTQWHAWVETVWWPPPFFFDRTSRSQYLFEASPGWVAMLRPRLSWGPWGGWTVEVSRWLPWAGGFRVATEVDPDGPPPAAGTTGGGDVPLSAWDLWLAGAQVRLTWSW